MRTFITCAVTLASMVVPAMATADIEVQFYGDNGDKFVITNADACPLFDATIEIDLSSSSGLLFFDVTTAAPGHGGPTPFSVSQGQDYLEDIPQIKDGDKTIILNIKNFPAEAVLEFFADTDYDNFGAGGQTHSSFSEGATVSVSGKDSVQFDSDGLALAPGHCGIIS